LLGMASTSPIIYNSKLSFCHFIPMF
jgi:hypothetical protein